MRITTGCPGLLASSLHAHMCARVCMCARPRATCSGAPCARGLHCGHATSPAGVHRPPSPQCARLRAMGEDVGFRCDERGEPVAVSVSRVARDCERGDVMVRMVEGGGVHMGRDARVHGARRARARRGRRCGLAGSRRRRGVGKAKGPPPVGRPPPANRNAKGPPSAGRPPEPASKGRRKRKCRSGVGRAGVPDDPPGLGFQNSVLRHRAAGLDGAAGVWRGCG